MGILLVWYAIILLLALGLLYFLYKVLWYSVKMLSFRRKLKKLSRMGYRIERKRGFLGMLFGKKGVLSFQIEIREKMYDVHLISFPSVHGRWNIEWSEQGCFVEARRRHRFFYNQYNNSSDEPEFSREFRKESRVRRCVLHLPQKEVDPSEGKLLLVYPSPTLFTYTEKSFEYLKSGSVVHGYTVVFWEDLWPFLLSERGDRLEE